MNGKKARAIRQVVGLKPSSSVAYYDTNVKKKFIEVVVGLNEDGTEKVRKLHYPTSTKVLVVSTKRAQYQALKRAA